MKACRYRFENPAELPQQAKTFVLPRKSDDGGRNPPHRRDLTSLWQCIPRQQDLVLFESDLNYFVHQVRRIGKFLQNEREQLPLLSRQNLRNDNYQSRMQSLSRIQFPKVTGIVRHEGKVFRDDPRHQIPIGLAAQAQPVDVKAIVALMLSHGHERCVQAFIDEKLHEPVPEGFSVLAFPRVKRFTDFTFSPCSDNFRGRPRAG